VNKILVIAFDAGEKSSMEEIFYDLMKDGNTELFFATTLEHGKEIMDREIPQVIFVDYFLKKEIEKHYSGTVIFVGNEDILDQTVLKRPLNKEQVLKICCRLLDLTGNVHETISI
jgi:hypothetical protein